MLNIGDKVRVTTNGMTGTIDSESYMEDSYNVVMDETGYIAQQLHKSILEEVEEEPKQETFAMAKGSLPGLRQLFNLF